ncbi:MAG: GspH/FimT family pseudopilin [Betaproteobacteria bacterium]
MSMGRSATAPSTRPVAPTPVCPSGGLLAPAGGFTLIETLIAITIAVALFAMALPSMRDWHRGYELATHAQYLAGNMTRARSEAVKRSYRVNLCRTVDRRQCAASGSWDAGWIVWVDQNHDGRIDDDEPVLAVSEPTPSGVTVHANRPLADYVSYTSFGEARRLDGALQMGTFSLCRPGQRLIKVVLANTGRVRIEKTGVACT